MISSILSRLVILLFGTLYPAYASYKAVKTKNVKEYVKWMMYWIVFALFTCVETFTDVFLSWLPFYYEIKIILVIWLLSPATKGSSILYRKFVHPTLSSREQEIDEYISKAKEKSYRQFLDLGSKGVTALMQTAIKGGGGIVNQLRKSYSLSELRDHRDLLDGTDEVDDVGRSREQIEMGDVLVTDPRLLRRARRRSPISTRNSSIASTSGVYFSEVDVSRAERVAAARLHVQSVEDISSGYSSGAEVLFPGQPPKLQMREGLVRTSSLSRTRPTRVTRSSAVVLRKTSVSEESDESEAFETHIKFPQNNSKTECEENCAEKENILDKEQTSEGSSSSGDQDDEFLDCVETSKKELSSLVLPNKRVENEKTFSEKREQIRKNWEKPGQTKITLPGNFDSQASEQNQAGQDCCFENVNENRSGCGIVTENTETKKEFSLLTVGTAEIQPKLGANADISSKKEPTLPTELVIPAFKNTEDRQKIDGENLENVASEKKFALPAGHNQPEVKIPASNDTDDLQANFAKLDVSQSKQESVLPTEEQLQRGGKYHKKAAPKPPPPVSEETLKPEQFDEKIQETSDDRLSKIPTTIKATLVLKPGIVKNVDSTSNLTAVAANEQRKEVFVHQSPKLLRRRKFKLSNDCQNPENTNFLKSVMKFPKKMGLWATPSKTKSALSSNDGFLSVENFPRSEKHQRFSWHSDLTPTDDSLGNCQFSDAKLQSKSYNDLSTIQSVPSASTARIFPLDCTGMYQRPPAVAALQLSPEQKNPPRRKPFRT